MAKIAVVGSINMDIVNHVEKHPLPGQTIHGWGTEYNSGGKGANQAVAAALAGGDVRMIGAVGTDSFAGDLLKSLAGYRVQTDAVLQKEGTSGLAFITVDASGENNIILSEGANGKVSVGDIESKMSVIEQSDVVLLQNEIPWETTKYVLEAVHARNIRVVLNPAPAFAVPKDVMPLIRTIALNETEAEVLTGVAVKDERQARAAADKLIDQGVQAVLLTLGEKGSVYLSQSGQWIRTPAFPVKAVDTTAAGDTFIGAFAVASQSGDSIEAALRFASAASAITVTRRGAQVSIPNRDEVAAFLASHPD